MGVALSLTHITPECMTLPPIPPTAFNWDDLVAETFPGASGHATVWTQNVENIRLRQVRYSAGYVADHWCDKGHVVFVVSGQLILEHKDHPARVIDQGSTYVVGDNSMPHKALSKTGATAWIVD